MNASTAFELLKQTYAEWNEDKAPRLGAALSYYTVFSLAPLLLVLISITGIFFGEEAARGEISLQIANTVGPQAAEFIEGMVEGARKPSTSIIATVIGMATLIFGAMGVFGQLQDALNTIWEVQPKPGLKLIDTIKARLTPFVMVLGVAFLLLSSLVVSAGIAAAGDWMSDILPLPEFVMQAINFFLGLAVITLMFAGMFKWLPDVIIQWRDVWIGAALTALLFMIGQMGLAWYVGKAATDSTYGAAGSLVAVLLWVYWTSQILFFGAEFTQVYANKYGSRLVPAPNAVPVTAEMRAQQGLSPRDSKFAAPAENSKPETRNLLAEARREEERKNALSKSHNPNAAMEDLGAVLAGFGIILILSRLFHRGDKT